MIYKYLCYKMSWHFIVTQDIINLNCFKKKMIKYLIRMIYLFLYFQNDKQSIIRKHKLINFLIGILFV